MKPGHHFSVVRNLFLLLILVASIFVSCKKENNNNQVFVTTKTVVSITQSTAVCGGTVTTDGGETILSRGICWSTIPSPTISGAKTKDGIGNGTFSSTMLALNSNTKYFVRAYATSTSSTTYGNEVSFTTLQTGGDTVTDIDGNVYHTVTIGNQVWMVENLKVTRYRKGDSIPNVTSAPQWLSLDKGAYCNYDKDTVNGTIYGRLYNWYAINDSRSICPDGWHVPTDSDWQTLIDYLGGGNFAGGKMKSTGTIEGGNGLWNDPNNGATNESGLAIIPGGWRHLSGNFSNLNANGSYWSSSETSMSTAWYRDISYKYIVVDRYEVVKTNGLSVRCIKDK